MNIQNQAAETTSQPEPKKDEVKAEETKTEQKSEQLFKKHPDPPWADEWVFFVYLVLLFNFWPTMIFIMTISRK